MLLKDAAEIQRIVISDNRSDFRHIIVCCLEEHLRVDDAYRDDILHGGRVCILFEVSDKSAHTHAPRRGIFLNIDLCIVVVIKVLHGSFHLCVQKNVPDLAV